MKQEKQNSSADVPIMDAEAIRRALRRIAHEIIERNPSLEKVVFAGIPSRGVEIARRVAAFICEIEKIDVETGVIDVSRHRDDVGIRAELPRVQACKLPLPLEKKTIIIVDDVCTTGASTITAIEAAKEAGMRVIAAICLVEREEAKGRPAVEAACGGAPFLRLFTAHDVREAHVAQISAPSKLLEIAPPLGRAIMHNLNFSNTL